MDHYPLISADVSIMRSALILFLVLVAAGCSDSTRQAEFKVTVDASEACANPTLVLAGDWWQTHDQIPRSDFGSGPVTGTLSMDGDRGALVTDSGEVLRYERLEGFSDHPCLLN